MKRALLALPLLLLAACNSSPKHKLKQPRAAETSTEANKESIPDKSLPPIAIEKASPDIDLPTGKADLTLVLLRSGTTPAGATEEQVRQLGAGHLANISRLANEHQLVLAGPFGDGRPDASLRGIVLLDTSSAAEAERWMQTDPAVAAGLFRVETHGLRTSSALREMLDIDLALEAERKAAAQAAGHEPQFDIQEYVLAEASTTAATEQRLIGLREEGRLLLYGKVLGEGEARAYFVLDSKDVEEARALLAPLAEVLPGLRLHPWWGSPSLLRLPTLDSTAGLAE